MSTPRGSGIASRLWMMLTPPGSLRKRLDDISKQFTGAGWKNLPQELVDKILGYLLDDPDALKACSRTCKHLFGATRPIIHRRVCLASKPTRMERPKPKGSLFSLRRGGHETFERLVHADRLGLLRYIRYLTFKTEDDSFTPENMQKYLSHLQSITNLHTLALSPFSIHPFIPVFHECFGMFTTTLRHLDIRRACGTGEQLLYAISQFPLLEDLTVVSPTVAVVHPGNRPPAITQSPPLRGTLVLVGVDSRELFEGLGALPGGLNSRSLELFQCEYSQIVLNACSHSVTSISYVRAWNDSWIPLDLKQSVVLERFKLTVEWYRASQMQEWLHRMLWTITSPTFNELVISIIRTAYRPTWRLISSMRGNGWKAVDASLNVLAGRNPDFRVVFRGYFMEDCDVIRRCFESDYLPLAWPKGFVTFEQVFNAENRLWELRNL